MRSPRAARAGSAPRAPSAREGSGPPSAAGAARARPSEKEQPVRRVARLVPERISEFFQKSAKSTHLRPRHLHADQHAAVVGALVAVMEQADVPVAAHAVE